ncbi:hypothetical protein CCP3SC1_180015 [Gammaproteobacteria bacterium]
MVQNVALDLNFLIAKNNRTTLFIKKL